MTFGAMAASAGALTIAMGTGLADRAVSQGLPSLSAVWQSGRVSGTVANRDAATNGLLPAAYANRVAKAVTAGAVAGDEGFWLSSSALAGGAGHGLAVGAQLSLGGRAYTVTELKPIVASVGDKSMPDLTLVVAREMNDKAFVGTDSGANASPAHFLRFLIESDSADEAGRLPHRSL